MPRASQLFRDTLLDSQFALGSEHEGHIPTPRSLPEFTGKKIGHWAIDPETKMPKLVLDKEFPEEEDEPTEIDPPPSPDVKLDANGTVSGPSFQPG